jgi:hypothetical protein
VAFVGFGIAIAASLFTTPPSQIALASVNENVRGWAWSDPIGWISMNDQNPGSGGGVYGVNVNLTTGAMTGFGWSDKAGWVCFGSSCAVPSCTGVPPSSNAPYNAMFAELSPAPYSAGSSNRNFHGWAKVCNAGDEGWISLNCSDVNPTACGSYAYRVPFDMTTLQFQDATPPGFPMNGTSFGWSGTNDGKGYGYIDFRNAYLVPSSESTAETCSNGFDDDLDGAIDCVDAGCAAACVPPPALTEDQCPLGNADLCCSDGVDNEGDTKVDCDDTDCQGNASMCTVAWLQTRFGGVYAQKGIDAIAAPASQYNASYCLSLSDGQIQGFASQSSCIASSTPLTLPSLSSGYKGTLGGIDIDGIANGRYGQVVQIADGNALPAQLDGKVYVYNGVGPLTLSAKQFLNGVGSNGRGNGLLLVRGADVNIVGDITYAFPTVDNYLRNLASFGLIVTRVAGAPGVGGRIFIDQNVSKISGALFAEESISTGASILPIEIYGMLASRALYFERTGGTSSTAAETVVFDGRAIANPPPGMQDIGKSLPTAKEAF